jgi:hypothetical protein
VGVDKNDDVAGDQLAMGNTANALAIARLVIKNGEEQAEVFLDGSIVHSDGVTVADADGDSSNGIQVTVGGTQFTVEFEEADPDNLVLGLGVLVSGVTQGTTLGVIVGDDANTPLIDSVEYHWQGGSTFKVGDFGALVPSSAGAVSFDFDLVLTDSDGDAVDISDGITINLEADPNPPAMVLEQEATQEQQLAAPLVETPVDDATDPTVQEATDTADLLVATDGADIFAWSLADHTEEGDVITGFDVANDAIDLRDLLIGEEAEGADLTSYLNVTSDGVDTVIKVSTTGDFKGNPSDEGNVDQIITLEGIDLVGGNDLDTVIQDMLTSGKLIVDQ